MHLPQVLPRRRRALVAVLAAACLTGGAALSDPAQPLAPGSAAAAKAKKPRAPEFTPPTPKYTLDGELRKLQAAGTVSATDVTYWRSLFANARETVSSLPKGIRRTELQAVVSNTQQIAARRALTASLAPSVFLTLQVNRDWWPTQPIPPAGARPVVPGSALTWQYYPGEGVQIQWLATFGNANALATTTTPAKLEQLRAIQDEAVRLASDRAGGPAWQYLFDFGGGPPPWGSGMAQVTAMQSLVRTTAKLGNTAYQAIALRANALLRHSSPTGARFKQAGGDHVLLYTFTKTRVMNAFIQAVSGLHEIAATTGDPAINAGYVRAERELRIELPKYVTQNWARYSMGGANETPSYHRLSRDLLRGLCRTLTADAEAFAAGQPVAGRQPPAPAAGYCRTADRFTQDLARTPNGPRSSTRAATRGAAATTARSGAAADPSAHVGGAGVSQP